MSCDCKDWEPNISIINGYISMQANMAWGNKEGYSGKPFDYCPWCGSELVKEEVEDEGTRTFSLIVAMYKERGIGKDGTLPWRIKEDMAHFKKVTIGNGNNVVIMGRKTWDSIHEKRRPLPDRTNVVISRQKDLDIPDSVLCVDGLDTALNFYDNNFVEDIFVIGGSQIYADAVKHPSCEKLIVTHIDSVHDCDVFFPEFEDDFVMINRNTGTTEFSFATYLKKNEEK